MHIYIGNHGWGTAYNSLAVVALRQFLCLNQPNESIPKIKLRSEQRCVSSSDVISYKDFQKDCKTVKLTK